MKRKCIVSFSILLFLSCLGLPHASALIHVPYSTYTYSVTGEPQKSPHAYIPVASLSAAEGMETGLSSPADIVTDKHDRLYIADTGNDRIVVLNSDLTLHGDRDLTTRGKGQSGTARRAFLSRIPGLCMFPIRITNVSCISRRI